MVGETPEKRLNQSTSRLHAPKTGVEKPSTHPVMDDSVAFAAEKAGGQRKQPESRAAGNCICDRKIHLLSHLISQGSC